MNGTAKVQIPGFSRLRSLYTAKGSSYLVAWAHRISGLLLLGYVLLHVNTLSSLSDPEVFSRKAQMFSGPAAVFAEWLLALPVIFHCLNGGRLLIYELFTSRYDRQLLVWVYTLSITYMGVLGYLMIIGNQQVSAHFFWLTVLIMSCFITYLVFGQIRKTGGSYTWKLQRLSGAILFIMVPAHMLFMHLNHEAGRDVQIISERMNQPLIIALDGVLLLCILYHGGYGLIGVVKDYYLKNRRLKIVITGVVIVLALFGFQGLMLMGSV